MPCKRYDRPGEPGQEGRYGRGIEMKKKKRNNGWWIVVILAAAAAIMLLVRNISFGPSMEIIDPGELESVTGVLYADGRTDSGEIRLDAYLSNKQSTGQTHMIYTKGFRSVRRGVPETGDFVQLRFLYSDGREREVRISEDEKWDYFEESGVGIWRREKSQFAAGYRYWRDECVLEEFDDAFLLPVRDGETPELLPDYSGAEKAVWLDRSQEDSNGDLYIRPSWSDSFERETPEGYAPERARDVRWLFIKTRTGHEYRGFWREVGTGRTTGSIYDNTYEVSVYDLVTGERKVVSEGENRETDIGDSMKAFFGVPG